jgi:small basic protein (TIGR04137 family)
MMSLDRSLRSRTGMGQTRSVLTRAERITKLQELKKMDPKSPKALGLQKTRVK